MVESYKNKFNKKYNQKKDKSNSIKQISKLTGYKLGGLEEIYNKGYGAYYSNPSSVRKSVKSPEAWSYARIYSAVMGGAAAKIDKDLLQK
tara:strand:+ start:608 stop:877 length:270 start_codon:yes stop_codon:yes gene_type:complete